MAIFDSPRGRRLRSARRAAGRGGRNFPAEPLAPFAHPAVGRAVRAGASVDRVRRLPRVKVGVVGLGTMGAGIAQVSIQAGFDTIGREIRDELAERGRATIDRYLTRGVEKGRM